MVYSLKEYKKVIEVGDIIRTNANGDDIVNRDNHDEVVEGRVIQINLDDNIFFINPDNHDSPKYSIYFENEYDNDAIFIEVLKKAEPQKPELGVAKKKRKMWIKLDRENGNVVLNLRVPQEIEDYYKTISGGEMQTSSKWVFADNTPVKFYKLSEEALKLEKRTDNQTFSDYGNGLVDSDYINTAMLRTVGVSSKKGVEIMSKHFNNTSNIDLKYFLDRFGLFVKLLWEGSISRKKIQALITYEI